MRWPVCYRYLSRLNVPTTESERSSVETTLGAVRILLGVLALVAFSCERPEQQFGMTVFVMLGTWIAYSVAVFFWVSRNPISVRIARLIHLSDMVWPTLITGYSHGVSSPFAPVFSFALLAAAFRWGFPEAIMTSGIGASVVAIQAFVLRNSAFGIYESNRLLIRCAYLLSFGYLLGKLGENEKVRRAESAVTTRLLNATRSERSMAVVLSAVLREYLRLFGGTRIFLVTHDVIHRRVYLWQMPSHGARQSQPYVREVADEERASFLLPDLPPAFHCRRLSPSSFTLSRPGPGPNTCTYEGTIPSLPIFPYPPSSLLGVAANFGKEWNFRLLVLDARTGADTAHELTFARVLFEQAASAIYGVYLVRRLRARASAMERARVARELHDGSIQSLISAEMRANILRRRAEREYPGIALEIESLEKLLRREVLELRQLMQQLKPVDVEPNQLVDHMAEQVDRFRRDTGISARFVSAAEDEVNLSSHACRELLLILQELLVNVRKHAGARDLLVTFGRYDGHWQLSASDDGKGFGFEGTLSGVQLMKSAKGPAIIKERVANLGAELAIESRIGRGSRLLIRLPQKGYYSHEQ